MFQHYHYDPMDPYDHFGPYPHWPPANPPDDSPDPDRWGCLASIISWMITLILLAILCSFI